MKPRTFWIWLSGIGVVALAVRFANVLLLRPLDQTCKEVDGCFAIAGDALYSHLQGELFAQGHGFASSFSYYFFGDLLPGAGDPPLYVIYLGSVSALHGSGGLGAFLLAFAVFALTVAAAWFIGRRVGGRRAGRIAAGVVAGFAVLLITVSALPGWGDSARGVHRPSGGDEPIAHLNDGEPVFALAVVDESAVTAHRLASGLVGVAGVVLIGLTGRRLGGLRCGLIGAGIAAVYPLFWINDAMVLSEALYVPMTALTILAGYRFWDRPDGPNAVLMGAAVALAGLTRAEALLLGVFMVIPLAWGRRKELGLGGSVREVAIAGAVCVALVLPWIGFNMLRFEEPTTMTAGTGAVLSAGSCDVAYNGEAVGYYGADCYGQYVAMGWEVWPSSRAEESVRDVPSRHAAVRYIKQNIEELPRVATFRVGRMWTVYKPTQNIRLDYQVEGRGRTATRLGFWAYAAVVPVAIGGLIVLWRRRIPLSPLLAQAATVTLTAALTFGVTRYRVPADAALVLAAAVGADALLRHWWPVEDGGTIARRPATAPWGRSGPSDPPLPHGAS